MSKKKGTISKILKLKDNKKKEVELEVKQAKDKVDKEKTKLNALENNYNETLEYFNRKNEEGSMSASHVNSYYEYFSQINEKICKQEKVHEERKSELKSLKNSLIRAHQDKKAYEILNEKITKEEVKEQLSSEQKEADFFAISRKSR